MEKYQNVYRGKWIMESDKDEKSEDFLIEISLKIS